jgi:hypothetical protein
MREYTILGERCSGTNFLETIIHDNFKLKLNWGSTHKHFFGYNGYDIHVRNNPDKIYIGIVRNPVDWLMSFFKKPHHQHLSRQVDINTFLLSEFYSCVDNTVVNPIEQMHDRNFKNNNLRYKNVFEMRSVKCNYLVHEFREIAKLYTFIRYEDLKNHTAETLSNIQHKFQLEPIRDEYYIESKYCTPDGTISESIIDIYDIPNKVKNIIKENLDYEIEIEMGYKTHLDRID